MILTPGAVALDQLAEVYWSECPVTLDPACRPAVEEAARRVAAGDAPVYGVNTGFGKLASVKIARGDVAALQRNLILSHCSGVGEPIPRRHARLMMALKLLSLGRGASGVRWELIDLLEQMLAREVTPVIPAQGSVGASGDLAPLAHMTAVLIGEGAAEYGGEVLPGAEALARAGLAPIALGPKEGLAFINGTQFSTAFALAGLFEAWRAAQAALVVSALSTDAIMGSTAPLQPEIHALRGHRGQIEAAGAMRTLLEGSAIRESHRSGDARVQDPYCIRCQPQVTGAAMDVLRQTAVTLRVEANAATDNPLVLEGAIVSGGNFHGEPVGFAADTIALAVAELGAIAQRRVALMVDPTLSFDLPPFLTPDPGLNSGFMIAEVTTAALMSENKHLATPCVTDSTPTSANQEDHVAMSAHGARRLGHMAENLRRILGVELLCAAQGVEFRAPVLTSAPLQRVLARLREDVPSLGADRYLAPDIEAAARLVAGTELTAAADVALPELGAVEVARGESPVILGQPHGGTWLPDDLAVRLNDTGRALADTDWHIARLYEGLLPGATVVRANFHRYLIDANRDPGGASLYPGQNTTGLCPVTDFDGRPIWREGQEPSGDEIAARVRAFHAPYHAALAEQVERVQARHGVALVYDCHSIRSEVPFLFDGILPVLNIGTNGGATCAAAIEDTAVRVCAGAGGFDHVLNGRFTGGWTTRHYGRPAAGVHAIQMEIAQRAYMEEAPPWAWRADRAERLRPALAAVLGALAETVTAVRHG